MKEAIDQWAWQLPDFMPPETRERCHLLGLPQAIVQAHYPEDTATKDTIAPTGYITINGDLPYTNNVNVTLNLEATDASGVDEGSDLVLDIDCAAEDNYWYVYAGINHPGGSFLLKDFGELCILSCEPAPSLKIGFLNFAGGLDKF